MQRSIFTTIFLAIVTISGFCGLVYQIVWERLARYNFGGDNSSATIIIAVFLLGLGLGAFAFRRVTKRPLLAYGIIEIGIGCFALVSFALISNLSYHLAQIISPNLQDPSSIRVLTAIGCVLFILPPCILMGGTLPLMFAGFAARNDLSQKLVGTIYGVNIFGAMAGTLAVPYLLLNNLPIDRVLHLTAVGNFVIGGIAIALHVGCPERSIIAAKAEHEASTIDAGWSLWITFLTGIFTSVVEVLLIRHAFQMIPASPYNFAFVISCVLLALSAGSLTIPARGFARHNPTLTVATLLVAAAAGLLCSIGASETLIAKHHLMPDLEKLATTFSYFLVVCFPAFFPLGAIFPILCSLTADDQKSVASRTGTLYLLNSIGAFLGAIAFNYIGSRILGGRVTVEILVLLLSLSAAWLFTRSASTRFVGVGVSAVVIVAASFIPMLTFMFGPRLLTAPQAFLREGSSGVAAVTWDPTAATGNVLVNGISMGEIPTEPKGIRQLGAALAAAPHQPRNVLVLGLGAGTFVREIVRFPSVKSITVVDWSRELPPLLSDKDVVSRVGPTLSDSRIKLLTEDARLMVKLLPKGHYDLILDNLVYPTWAGATGVRTDSFFANVSSLLTSDGVYGITTNYARWRGEMLAGLLKNFRAVYENEKGYMVVATNLERLAARPSESSYLTALLWPASVGEKSGYEISENDYGSMLVGGLKHIDPSTINAKPFTEERLFSEYYYTSREFLSFIRR